MRFFRKKPAEFEGSDSRQESQADALLAEAMQGVAEARERLIELNKGFICKVACEHCQRQLAWDCDDELSVALIAFNEAIDTYKAERRAPFWGYARLVIKHRLTDYLRKEHRQTGRTVSVEEVRSTQEPWVEDYGEEIWIAECAAEISRYESLLSAYGLSLADLVKSTPRHTRLRRQLIAAARALARNQACIEHLRERKKLPLQELSRLTGFPLKVLERGRKYIVGLGLVLASPEDFPYINTHLEEL
ncbi:MAG TPA: RNA polymerase subunit sigma [Desulfotomaculum sp.]|nr:RNA polymerase subunit sigma [Desulfotomaculum sp.]